MVAFRCVSFIYLFLCKPIFKWQQAHLIFCEHYNFRYTCERAQQSKGSRTTLWLILAPTSSLDGSNIPQLSENELKFSIGVLHSRDPTLLGNVFLTWKCPEVHLLFYTHLWLFRQKVADKRKIGAFVFFFCKSALRHFFTCWMEPRFWQKRLEFTPSHQSV